MGRDLFTALGVLWMGHVGSQRDYAFLQPFLSVVGEREWELFSVPRRHWHVWACSEQLLCIPAGPLYQPLSYTPNSGTGQNCTNFMFVSSLHLYLQPPITNLGRCFLLAALLQFVFFFFCSFTFYFSEVYGFVLMGQTCASICASEKANEIYCFLANTEERGNSLHNETGDPVLTMSFLSYLHSTEYTNIKDDNLPPPSNIPMHN